MKPFNLDAAKSGALLITRDGRKARFIAHVPECNDGFRVLAFIDGNISATEFDDNGRFVTNDDPRDLFMYEEEKKPVVRWLWTDEKGDMTVSLYTEDEAKVNSPNRNIKIEWSRTEFPE